VLTFDFKSLYPSIMRTFNIDPLTRLRGEEGRREALTAPNGARFRREPASFPGNSRPLLSRAAKRRASAATAGRCNAYKIVMNSFTASLGTPAVQFAASALAGASRRWASTSCNWARDQVTAAGYE